MTKGKKKKKKKGKQVLERQPGRSDRTFLCRWWEGTALPRPQETCLAGPNVKGESRSWVHTQER